MFFKKNKEVVKKHKVEVKKEPYVIPQILDDTVGLRDLTPTFEKTVAVSPMEGTYTKDVLNVPEVEIKHDIDIAYDPFRVEKKLTEEDEIRRFGRTNHEFPSIDNELDVSKYLKKEPTVKTKQTGSVGIDFGVVYDSDEVINSGLQKATPNPFIHFNEPETPNVKDIEFDQIAISNDLQKEQETFIAKPISRVPEFVQPIADSVPKTIVLGKAPEININDIPVVTIPPFVAPTNYGETEIIIDTPSIVPPSRMETASVYQEPKTIIEEVKPREPVQTVIYEDKYANYKLPPVSLLDPINKEETSLPDWIYEKSEIINSTLAEFGIEGEVVNQTYGPSVTRYEVKLNSGVNVKKVNSIADNLKMNLSAKSIRIEAPIPGKSNVGIEVPNDSVRTVAFAEIILSDEFQRSTKPLTIAMGLSIEGEAVCASIAKMPHGLIAGGTGNGKSVFVNNVLISLLMKYSPKDLKLIIVDPKRVEFLSYQSLPHLATPVITEPKMANDVLKWSCTEMDRRYSEFMNVRARDITSYNERISNDPTAKKMPYLVVVIDELADLILQCGNEVEASIQRITQMGRACGIHLLVATQRPTTDVIKGTIKSNIATRIAFKVPQTVDSLTILDQGGAETLLGRGDMLYKTGDIPQRLQGAFISDDEIYRVCDYIANNYAADYIFTHEDLQNSIKQQYGATGTSAKDGEDMELLYSVAMFVVERGVCSINSIQTSFNLGFRRAQRIVEILEELGIVSGSKGTTGREILVTMEDVKQKFKMGE